VKVSILYFARLREAIGLDREVVEVPRDVESVAALRRWIAGRGEPWSSAFAAAPRIRAAVGRVMADDSTALQEGAEVAFFPPVTGG